MDIRQITAYEPSQQKLVQQINETLQTAFRELTENDLTAGTIFPRGLFNWRLRDVAWDQANRVQKEIYDVPTPMATWVRYEIRYTWNGGDCLLGTEVLDPNGNTVGRWSFFWKNAPAGDAGPSLARIEKTA